MTSDDKFEEFKTLYDKIVTLKKKEIEWKEYI
jgi:hypothetical protein